MKIVIVEDEIRIREGIIKLINKYYSDIEGIYEAKSGDEGLEVIRHFEPDVVITDIRMEPIDGLKMLEVLIEQEKLSFKTIIISAYSEFTYAKQGIKLGISDYLVKPIDVNEFRKAMQHVRDEIAREKFNRQENPEKLRSFETVLTGMLSGQLILDTELEKFIGKSYGISADTEIALICVYLGKHYMEESQPVAKRITTLLIKGNYNDYHVILLSGEKEVLFTVSGDIAGIEKYFQYNVMRELHDLMRVSAVLAFTVCTGFGKILGGVKNLHEFLPWAISFGSDTMISHKKISYVQPCELVYPMNIEKDTIEALCAMDYARMKDQVERLLEYMKARLYSPDAIKKNIIRYLLAILIVIREVNFLAYEKLTEGEILESAARVVTQKELEAVVSGLLEAAVQRNEKTLGLMVRKAQRMVDEFYSNGITLKEVALALNMTPEHISSLFIKELGINFSTYIRNFRLKKAKELLLGTDLKLYEIAKQVGYSDAKYFGRVFKEIEGVLPVEYRQIHK